MTMQMDLYDNSIPDIEEDLPFLPESMKKRKVLSEEGKRDQNDKIQEAVALAREMPDAHSCTTYSLEIDGAYTEGIEDIEDIEDNSPFIYEDNSDGFNAKDTCSERKYIILIIYDIVSNKQRVKMAKLLSGYGNRVQKSAFEARLDKKRYARLLMDIKRMLNADDNVRIYKLHSYEEIKTFGDRKYEIMEDVIVV